MSKNLLIVESPAKAKTIEKFLGKDFKVKSSFGHVRDLSKEKMGVDIENNFEPKYIVSPDKQKVVKDLKDWVKKVDHVWLATDDDREGEAISWHLCKVLGLDEKTTNRIVFREITEKAVKKAVESPGRVDLNLVDAQQARRVLDRLVGFELSQILWKKVRNKLSAGRVQSVAVELVVEREREIQNFKPEVYFKTDAIFIVRDEIGRKVELIAELPTRFKSEKEAHDFLNKCKAATYSINKIEVKPAKRKPSAPFTTSTLQQEASRKLGFGVKRTMSTAQRLYEQGFISYMRTDSTFLSDTALSGIADEITSKFGKEYLEPRKYKSKSSSAQEAHEAIRPAYFEREVVSSDRDEQKLYELIWKRAIASQMSDALLEKTKVEIGISSVPDQSLVAKGEVLKFDGFLRVYMDSKEEGAETSGILPPLKVGQNLDLKSLTSLERLSRSLGRFSEASLVKKLEELEIGRPSTYAPTISRIMEQGRGYVVKETREGKETDFALYTLQDGDISKKVHVEKVGGAKNRLFPTDMGMIVSDFLRDHFADIMEYSFTAEIEREFDEIAKGNRKWPEMLAKFYTPFHKAVEKTLEEAERATGERILGKDPVSGRTLLVRMSKFGPVVQIGQPDELEEDEKPKYASLRPGQSLETIDLETAIDLFQLPKTVGQYEDKDVIIGIGRFGPYVKFDDTFISLMKGEDPMGVDLDRAIELIEQKRKADAPIGEYKGHPYTKGVGRFGPFLKWNGFFVNIPRRFDPDNITEAECHELIDAKIEKEANRYIHRWEDEKISVENGRWGPFIRFKKKSIKIPKINDKRATAEDVKDMTIEEAKKIIEAEIPGAFTKKKRAAPKKKATKKTVKKK